MDGHFIHRLFLIVTFILVADTDSVHSSSIKFSNECPDGMADCVVGCNINCRAGCDVDGVCFGGCVAGWTGPLCDEECPKFQYGVNCQKACGHCENDSTCNPVTGQCPGRCFPGFTGSMCNKACDPFFYGYECKSRCHHCRNDKACHVVTGVCSTGCALGWTGDKCDIVCENMTYGMDCTGQCGHCLNNKSCDHETGECTDGCASGWTGNKCDIPCSQGWYGEECDFHCGHCKTGTCDQVTGRCQSGCDPGWKGTFCTSPCEPGMYGEDCVAKCGNCIDKLCDRTTGFCTKGCKPGWKDITCHKACDDGTYGKSCSKTCGQCKDGSPCNTTTGICETGCKPGWDGQYCTQKAPVDNAVVPSTSDIGDLDIRKPSTVSLLVVIIVLLFIALSSTVIYFLCIRPRHADIASQLTRLSSVRSTDDAEPHLYEQVSSGPWEITKANLVLTTDKLGQGQFGQVRKGYIKNIRSHNVPVAVKSLKVNSSEKDKTDFMNELMILKKVGHHANVVCLVGSCNIGGTLYVAMEYCCHGDLRTHLRNHRKRKQKLYTNVQNAPPLSYSAMLKFALDVASGMAHLADRQIIHRDLAARNVLLDDNYTAKVADFGLSKNDDTYVKTSRSKVPVRWLALESIYNNTYTIQSDVWSFGVLLWEITTFGGTPYHGMDTQQFCALLKQGYRLCRPRHSDMSLYTMMLQCWQEQPEGRPEFSDLQSRLQCMVDDTQIYINIDEEMSYTNMDGEP
ncbi:transmembrane receptor protein tyrosine kinase [Mactra antiquata]